MENCLLVKYVEDIEYTMVTRTYALNEIYADKFMKNVIGKVTIEDAYDGFATKSLKLVSMHCISKSAYHAIMELELTNDEDDLIKLLN
jgi:hypothetical protein